MKAPSWPTVVLVLGLSLLATVLCVWLIRLGYGSYVLPVIGTVATAAGSAIGGYLHGLKTEYQIVSTRPPPPLPDAQLTGRARLPLPSSAGVSIPVVADSVIPVSMSDVITATPDLPPTAPATPDARRKAP